MHDTDLSGSDTSAKSMLLLALHHCWVSLWRVGESNCVHQISRFKSFSPEEVCIGMFRMNGFGHERTTTRAVPIRG